MFCSKALKILLKEKELKENLLVEENKSLKEKNDNIEKTNMKLQNDLDLLTAKLNELTLDTDKYANYLRTCEEQLNLSEKKREELKQDAQETIKL